MKRRLYITLFLQLTFWGLHAQSVSELFTQTKAHYEADDFRKTVYFASKYLSEDSLSAEVFKMRGDSYFELNQLDGAYSDYLKALAIDSLYASVYFNLGNLYQTKDSWDTASYYFRSYVNLVPEDVDGHFRLAVTARYQGDLEASSLSLKKAYELDSTNVGVLYYMAQNHFYEKEYSHSMELVKTALLLDSLSTDIYVLKGLIHNQMGQFSIAEADFKYAYSLDSTYLDAWVLAQKAGMFSQMEEGSLRQSKDNEFRFVKHTSNQLKESMALLNVNSGTLSTYQQFRNRIEQGELLSAEEYYLFYISQSLEPKYAPYEPRFQEIENLFQEEKYEEVMSYSQQVLDANPLAIDNLFFVAASCLYLNEFEEFQKFYKLYLGILTAILSTGDGDSTETALVVMSARDEYSVIEYLGFYSQGQVLLNENGHAYDQLNLPLGTFNEEGEENVREMYFNIDIPFGSLSKMFDTPSSKKKKSKKKRKS